MYLSHDDIRRLITLLRENLYLLRAVNSSLKEREEAIRLTKIELERLTAHLNNQNRND